MKIKPTVTIIGLGYVGLPLLRAVVECGRFTVYGYDIDKEKLTQAGSLFNTVKEPFLLTSDPSKCLPFSDYVVICVPTPLTKDNTPNYSFVKNAIKTVATHVKEKQTLIIESTVEPGACRKVLIPLLEKYKSKKYGVIYLAHCPERINPGDSLWNIKNIPRNIGGLTRSASVSALRFYSAFIKAPLRIMDTLEEAESTKLVENVFRDVNIALANELAATFSQLNIDYLKVLAGAGSKPFSFIPHFPGCGVGGDCIPTAPYFLIHAAKKNSHPLTLVRTARSINENMPGDVVKKFLALCAKTNIDVKRATVSVFGLSYKAGIADTRNSPAMHIIASLKKIVLSVRTHDPYVLHLSTSASIQHALYQSDAVIICTPHKEFVRYVPEHLPSSVRFILDGRNCIDPEIVRLKGILYAGIGR